MMGGGPTEPGPEQEEKPLLSTVTDNEITPPDDAAPAVPDDESVPDVIAPATTGILSITPGQTKLTDMQIQALSQIGINLTGPRAVPQAAVYHLFHIAQRTGLDPWQRQLHLMAVWNEDDEGARQKSHVVVTGIGALQGLAQSCRGQNGVSEWQGMDGPQFLTPGPDGEWVSTWTLPGVRPVAARARAKRVGSESDWSTVYLDEVAPTVPVFRRLPDGGREATGEYDLAPKWRRNVLTMLGKCAKAATIRDVFADATQGLYAHEEMERAEQVAETREAEVAQSSTRRSWADDVKRLSDAGRGSPTVIQGLVVGDADGKAAPLAADSIERIERAQKEVAEVTASPVLDWSDAPVDERCSWLHEELVHAAETLGVTLEALTARHERTAGPWQSWGPETLANCVLPLRGTVAMRMSRAGRSKEALAYREVGDLIAPLNVLLGASPAGT